MKHELRRLDAKDDLTSHEYDYLNAYIDVIYKKDPGWFKRDLIDD